MTGSETVEILGFVLGAIIILSPPLLFFLLTAAIQIFLSLIILLDYWFSLFSSTRVCTICGKEKAKTEFHKECTCTRASVAWVKFLEKENYDTLLIVSGSMCYWEDDLHHIVCKDCCNCGANGNK